MHDHIATLRSQLVNRNKAIIEQINRGVAAIVVAKRFGLSKSRVKDIVRMANKDQ